MKGAHTISGRTAAARHSAAGRLQRAIDRALRPFGLATRSLDELAAADLAWRFDYYWYNARKKRDIREDPGFGSLARKIIARGRTYLHYDRLYTLWQAVSRLANSSLNVAEVGAYRGGSARFIAEALRWHARTNPFYVFDTFEGHAVVDPAVDGKHQVGKQFRATSADRVAKYLQEFSNAQVVKGNFLETAGMLDDVGPFGLVHIDVDVYPVTLFCLDYFADRVVTGGVIVIDDYGFRRTKGALRAVEEFVTKRPDYCRFHLLTGQALLVRVQQDQSTLADPRAGF
jgi:O-methyltransferase